jgi:FtsP/CotA-like multicopper oxidase with cupredoxin domain
MVGAGKLIPSPAPGDGIGTFYWTNQQSSRLMFYHDHTHGITRLNVYAGEAAGYLITDAAEEALIAARDIPNICTGSDANASVLCEYKFGIPLVIQDKSFVPANVATQDDLWSTANWGGQGNLWFPHVYEPAQSLTSPDGLNPMGRWDYGPWVWPPSPVTNPTLPALSTVPEAFMDTPLVNGTAYPYLDVQPKAYRFRVLSAGNDRTFNLQLYYGATAAGTVCNNNVTPAAQCTEVNMVPAVPRQLCTALVTTNCVCDAAGGQTPAGCFPPTWPVDGRDGGVPDPATAGPQMIQIGTESGFLPAPVTLANHPIDYDDVGNVSQKTLVLMAAERADILIDFTSVPQGSTIILYNDAPSAFPGGDPRYDYYTGNPDATLSGGAPSTLAGFGPNTRTIMQFRVTNAAAAAPVTTVNTGTLPAALAAAYTAGQPAHIVPNGTYAKLLDTSMTVGGVIMPFKGKSINEGFDSTYGRINAMLGTEDPSGLNPPTPLEYAAPATEIVANDQVQLWKVVHNGVDSHPIHFHLMDVQVVNRMGWDGSIRPPDPAEAGWKETVRMNPMEDIVVAMRPTLPQLPFTLPNSIRTLDPTQPESVTNPSTNFGHEYVWHCHILGHEEFDLMRPIVLNVDQLLYAVLGSSLWQWDMGSWTQINATVPANMVASGSNLYATYTGAGVYQWNGATWTQLNATVPTNMVASGTNLYATFAGAGVYLWNGATWTQLNATVPTSMVASGTNLYATFATPGLYQWNGTAWSQITTLNPTNLVASGAALYVDFGASIGVYKWEANTWTQLNPATTTAMVAGF